MKTRPLTEETGGTCDWGHCDAESAAERYDDESDQWLPVCARHGERTARPSPGRGHCPRCAKSYALTVSGLVRAHDNGWRRCAGSGMGPL